MKREKEHYRNWGEEKFLELGRGERTGNGERNNYRNSGEVKSQEWGEDK